MKNSKSEQNAGLMKTNFVGGKLKLKNQRNDKTMTLMKKVITRDVRSKQTERNKEIENEEIVGFVNEEEQDYIRSLEKEIKKESKKLYVDNRTAAEKLFEERKFNKLPDRIRKNLELSYKQKFENFNKTLTKLPEHYDIPKVGPG